ncbi:MAG: hypothetical protein A2Z57_06440 [Planctomycetes bacterium RIFCSPHIGHO2_12_39_6]|nr:MAG: hypothetical protein A2Z57_06440 [Planctomycetes bacterium RIFCSPHIGHO2_12_39_6]
MKILDGYKKLITVLTGMCSVNYVAYLIFNDTVDVTHRIELYSLVIVTLGAMAGVHGMLQSKIDMKKILPNDKKI